ncbi:helix-turn-helix domain-containing protein [soil metagenome]
MAPLDTGYVTHTLRLVDTYGHGVGPSADDHATLGAHLKAVREHKTLSIGQVVESTRIRRQHLVAIEDGDRSALPSRPFALGYVRSYARALGLDGDLAVARFKAEWPESAEPLRNPTGVEHDEAEPDARKPFIWAGVTVIVLALGAWNLAQRTLINDAPPASGLDPAVAAQPLTPPKGPMKLSAAEPAPQESTTPVPYVTPGLAGPVAPVAKPDVGQTFAPTSPTAGLPLAFTPKGVVFGYASGPIILQARKPASLVVRGADKTVYFARQLAAGEAFRAVIGKGLGAEVSDPSAFVLYVANELKGPLISPQTAIDKLAPPPAAVVAAPPLAVAPVPAR